jgi:hypothetical protein
MYALRASYVAHGCVVGMWKRGGVGGSCVVEPEVSGVSVQVGLEVLARLSVLVVRLGKLTDAQGCWVHFVPDVSVMDCV